MSVELREMLVSDLPLVLKWRNLDGVRKNMYTSHVISEVEHQNWWARHSCDDRVVLLMAVKDGVEVGVVTFTEYTGENGTATWAFYAGDDAPRGTGSMMEAAALEFAFSSLKLRKLECEVLGFNMPVVHLHQRHGFEVEGIFKNRYERDGEYFDIYSLALTAECWNKYIKPMLDDGSGRKIGLCGKTFSEDRFISADMIQAFVDATGDANPIHLDDVHAKELGFPGRIAHGMLVGSLFSPIFATKFPGPRTVYLSQSLDFIRPVLIEGEVKIRLKVLSHVGRRLLVETQIYQSGELCVNGYATVLAPKNDRG